MSKSGFKKISRRAFIAGGCAAVGSVGLAFAIPNLSKCNFNKAECAVSAGISSTAENFVIEEDVYPLLACISWHVFEALYRKNVLTGEAVPCIAEGIPVKVDNLTYDVKVRSDKRYSNGDYVKIDDMTYVWDYTVQDELYASLLDFIADIQKINDQTIRFKLNYEIDIQIMMERLSLLRIFKILNSKLESYDDLVGSGPYVYKSGDGKDGSKIEFIPNEYYTGDTPPDKNGMILCPIVDDNQRVDALLNHRVNVIDNTPSDRLEEIIKSGFETQVMESTSMAALCFNCKDKPFNDVRVRQAMFYAIDVDKCVNDTLLGYVKKATSIFPEYHNYYHRASNVYSYDLMKAKNLLKEAGQERFRLNLLCQSGTWEKILSNQIQRDLGAIGISVYIVHTDLNWYDVASSDDNDYHIALVSLDPTYLGRDPDLLFNLFYGDNFITNKTTFWKHSLNSRYNELQQLLKNARILQGNEEHLVYDKCQDLVSEEVPIYPLFHRMIITSWNSQAIKDFTPIPMDGLSLLGCYDKDER